MLMFIVITTFLAYSSTIFIYLDETSYELNYLLIVKLIGQSFGSHLWLGNCMLKFLYQSIVFVDMSW